MTKGPYKIKIHSTYYRIDYLIIAILFSIMAIVAFVNILGRYLFAYSLSFTEAITIQLFVWLVVIGSGIAFERGAQLGMISFFRIFPHIIKKFVIIVSGVLGMLLFAVIDVLLILDIYNEITIFHAKSAALNIPVWIFYAGVPLFSLYVFSGIYRGTMKSLRELSER